MMFGLKWETYNMPYEVDKVFDKQGGIYFFSLRFPSNYELGMKNKNDIERPLTNLKAYLDLYESINDTNCYEGQITDKKAKHIRKVKNITIDETSAISPSKLLSDITITNHEELKEIVQILRTSMQLSNPIYVGIAKDQSLQQRLDQHIAGSTNMLKFMKLHNVSWDKVQYNCFPVKNLTVLRKLEKVIQNLSKPKFSTT